MTLTKAVVAGFCLLSFAALAMPAETPVVKVPFLLMFGWVAFLQRVLPQMSPDWSAIASAVGCLIVLGCVLHWLGRWLATWPGDVHIAWRWFKAPVMLVGVVALFWAGLASVGLIRSTRWLFQLDGRYVHDRSESRPLAINNMKATVLAIHNHNDQFNKMPPGTIFDSRGRALHSWQTALLPYVEQDELYRAIRLDLPWNHRSNQAHFRQRIVVYEQPLYDWQAVPEFPVTHFAGNVNVLGGRALRIPLNFPDGTSNTILFGEAAGNFPPWGKPLNWRDPTLGINRGPKGFGHPRAPGALFALGDASVRFVNEKISPATLKALATPAGGEIINDPEW